ncbi:protein FAM131B isoform X2 [Lates japonicus]|uniref:Protein FAM131B isoform X2 n=1 Tax=Lates japonicus TaxID=270547 RepID=A0AAD3M3W1_LATJO|nr:protein FAM131B isoform X2 [Lates japonicus]
MGCIGSRRLTADGVPVQKDGEQHGRQNFMGRNQSVMEDTTPILPRLKRNSKPRIGHWLSLLGDPPEGKSDSSPQPWLRGRAAHMIEWQTGVCRRVGCRRVPQFQTHPGAVENERAGERRHSVTSDGEKNACCILQQFGDLRGNTSSLVIDGWREPASGSNQGSGSSDEVNQEYHQSRSLHHSSAEVRPATYVSPGHSPSLLSDARWGATNNDLLAASPRWSC